MSDGQQVKLILGKGEVGIMVLKEADTYKLLLTPQEKKAIGHFEPCATYPSTEDYPVVLEFLTVESLDLLIGELEKLREVQQGNGDFKLAPARK